MRRSYDLTSRLEDYREPPDDWALQGACIGHDQDLWFPERGAPIDGVKEAKAICATCPVMEQCREYGKGERYGIWGGLSLKDRRNERAGRRAS